MATPIRGSARSRPLGTLWLASLVSTALATLPAAAHLLELPNKMRLSRDQYLTVQQIYRGWSLTGIPVLCALASTTALVIRARARGRGRPARLALAALLCIAGTQAIFWSLTFPANRLTKSWKELPPRWEAVRRRWEYSHAAAALLDFAAMGSLIRAYS
jgi:hypothetical protein